MKNSNPIIKNIKTLRQRNNWSQGDVACLLGITISAYSKIETGATDISLARMEQIARVYQIGIMQLLSVDEKEPESELSELTITRQQLENCKLEVADLQHKVITLFEELRTRTAY